MIAKNKTQLVQTLDFFDVNTVKVYPFIYFLNQEFNNVQNLDIKYGVRTIDRRGGGGLFIHGAEGHVIKNHITLGNINEVSQIICQSMIEEDKNNLICNGEVEIYKDKFNTWNYRGFINRKKTSLRDASTSDERINIINRFQVPQKVIDILWKKGILNYVIEFSLYDKPLGIKNEELIIWEIRRY